MPGTAKAVEVVDERLDEVLLISMTRMPLSILESGIWKRACGIVHPHVADAHVAQLGVATPL